MWFFQKASVIMVGKDGTHIIYVPRDVINLFSVFNTKLSRICVPFIFHLAPDCA